MIAEVQAFIKTSVAQHKSALQKDFQTLLEQQKADFQTQIRDLELQQQEEVEALESQIHKEAKRTKKARKWRKKLIKVNAKLTQREVHNSIKRAVVMVWQTAAHDLKNRKNKDQYCRDFHKRGRLLAYLRTWRSMCRFRYGEQAEDMANAAAVEAEEATRRECEEEMATLKLMISDLTEDLRRETLARAALLQQFQEAVSRSVSALSTEADSLEHDPVSRRNFHTALVLSPVSKQLLYSAD